MADFKRQTDDGGVFFNVFLNYEWFIRFSFSLLRPWTFFRELFFYQLDKDY